jgi:hypothetical protein
MMVRIKGLEETCEQLKLAAERVVRDKLDAELLLMDKARKHNSFIILNSPDHPSLTGFFPYSSRAYLMRKSARSRT